MSKETKIKKKFAKMSKEKLIDSIADHYVSNIVSSSLEEEKKKLSKKKLN